MIEKQSPKENQFQKQQYTIQEWYQALKLHTMTTIFIPLSQQQMDLIVTAFDFIYDKYFKELKSPKKQQQSFVYSKTNWIFNSQLQTLLKHKQLLDVRNNLLLRISSQLTKSSKQYEKNQSSKYFVKLSLRSPKDSLALRKYKQHLFQNVYKGKQQEYEDINMSNQLQRLSLKIGSGEQMLEILCSSQRVKDDIVRLKNHQYNYKMQVIIREWKTIPACLEFRIFMKNRKLTAISSYYKSQAHQWLLKYRQIVKEQVSQYFNLNVLEFVPYNDGVFDIGFEIVSENQKDIYNYKQIQQQIKNKKFSITIIEINPFTKQTGAALFNWQIDKQLLQNGPLQVRLSGEQDL